MDGNDGTLAYLPCEEHQEKKRRCDPKKCGKGKWKTVESKRVVCDACKKRKRTCTHKLPGAQAPINPEPDPGLSTFQKPASGKSKRAQEVPAAGTSSAASKPAASGGKSKRAEPEVPLEHKPDPSDPDVDAEMEQEVEIFRAGLRELLAPVASPIPNEGAALTQEEQEAAQDFCSNNALR